MKLNSIKYSCLILSAILLTSCQQELYKSNNKYNIPEISTEAPLVQFLIEPTNYTAILETENLAKAYDYSKIAHKTLWINQFNEKLNIAPTARVVTLHETAGLNDMAIDSLLKFVSKGGTLFVTKAAKDDRMSFFYGMTPDADWSTNTKANGFNFIKPLFPGMQDKSFDNRIIHRGFDSSNFTNNTNILVSAYNDRDYPVLIENKIGNGRVLLFNSAEVLEKEMRGLLFAATLIGLEGVPYPIANTATIFLDDFPSPVYDNNEIPIRSSIGEGKSQFIQSDWWPKMKKLAQDENLKYSTYLTFNINKNTSSDLNFKGWDKSEFSKKLETTQTNTWINTEIIKPGHELGFKGYNSVPFMMANWEDSDQMVAIAKASDKKWNEGVSKIPPISYVAPNNQIDSLGLISLKKGFPSLSYLHTSFYGELEKGGNREFDPDPLNSRFFDFPRISEGHEISASERWAIESTYLYTGIWTHTLNYQDIFNSSTTDVAINNFKKLLVDYKTRHPFMRFLPAKLATESTMDWRYQSVKHLMFEGQYEVSSSINTDVNRPSFWLMYIDNSNTEKLSRKLNDEQINFEKVPLLNGHLYHIKTNTPSLSVPDIRPEIQNLVNTTSTITKKMISEYNSFNMNKEKLVPLKKQIDRMVVDEKTEKATDLMQELFEGNKYINTNQIETYAKSMIKLNKENQLWQELNDIYMANPSLSNAFISQKVVAINGYPSKELKKLWLERQFEWDKTDLLSLKNYYTEFNTPKNAKKIEQVLESIVKLEPNAENTKNYINFLVNTDNDKLLPTLDAIQPCGLKDQDLPTTISLAYAEKLNFKEAIKWAKCADNITPELVQEWKLKSTNIEDRREIDFPFYFEYLLVNDPEKAILELQSIKTCEPELMKLDKYIAIFLGENLKYKKALEWANCSQNVPIKYLMDWNSEIGDISQLKRVYEAHINKNPKDYETMNYMAKLLLLNGKIEDAGKIAISIPPNKLDSEFKIAFNNEIQNQTDKSKTLYINTFKILMDDAIVKKAKAENRKKKGNSIGFTSNAWADKFEPTLLNNRFHYGIYNKNEDFHRFTISQATAYKIFNDTLIFNDEGRDLIGLEYKFSKESIVKSPYWISTRVEMDNFNKFFFHFNTGINLIGENSKTTFELDVHPIRTGPGYVINIYDYNFKATQLINYSKNLKQAFNINSSYYTDNQYYATGSSRIDYQLINLDKFGFGPSIEGAYSQGSEERRNGFPYWLTEERLLGGGGLTLRLGNEETDFNFSTDVFLFTEQDEPNFERYQGNLSYRIKDFTQINLNYNYFTIDRFFSNAIQLGIQYNFK